MLIVRLAGLLVVGASMKAFQGSLAEDGSPSWNKWGNEMDAGTCLSASWQQMPGASLLTSRHHTFPPPWPEPLKLRAKRNPFHLVAFCHRCWSWSWEKNNLHRRSHSDGQQQWAQALCLGVFGGQTPCAPPFHPGSHRIKQCTSHPGLLFLVLQWGLYAKPLPWDWHVVTLS